jgi:EAL domain-containing protein (putative c-di-GMP-specific phosphodiesterase class I)
VIEEACRQSREWQAQGRDLYVSINLPARFWRLTAIRTLLETVTSFGLSPGRLMIEITESAAMEHPENNGAIIEELLKHGVRVAIDDFGTGHSSLARLNQLAATTLKIDRSFIRDLPHDANAAVLVKGIIQLARSLGLDPLAEGIETAEQRAFLLEHDCHLGQGYYFSRPVPAPEIPAYAPPRSPLVADAL